MDIGPPFALTHPSCKQLTMRKHNEFIFSKKLFDIQFQLLPQLDIIKAIAAYSEISKSMKNDPQEICSCGLDYWSSQAFPNYLKAILVSCRTCYLC